MYFIRRPWDLPQRLHTPPEVYFNRRDFLKVLGIAGIAGGCQQATEEEIHEAGWTETPSAHSKYYPAARNDQFEYGRPETTQRAATEFTNFYEFSSRKDTWRLVSKFKPTPWKVSVEGECAKPAEFDLDDLHQEMTLEERHYRHRCVETWAMCVPWTGFPLANLLKKVEPKSNARYVAFETFNRPNEARHMTDSSYPWPYSEGLTIEEAMNDLCFIATGLYGEPLLKQNGAPIRLVVPWKYGFKSIKSIVRIMLTEEQPATFWNSLIPSAYDFEANVDPDIPHPNWPQDEERMLGTGDTYKTKKYNGYGKFVGGLYS